MNVQSIKSTLNPTNPRHAQIARILSNVQIMKGEDGKTPVKGVDYFTPAEIREIFSVIEQKINTFERGLKGERGIQGPEGKRGINGKDGKTPIKGLDYFTPEEINEIVFKVLSKIKQPKDGISPDINTIVSTVLKKISIPENPENVKKSELIAFLKRGGFRGGGDTVAAGSGISITLNASGQKEISTTGGGITILTATGTIDDSNVVFTFVSKPTEIVINGSSYIENGGWTWAGLTATLDFPVGSGGKIYGRS